jgi:hypothetical protein
MEVTSWVRERGLRNGVELLFLVLVLSEAVLVIERDCANRFENDHRRERLTTSKSKASNAKLSTPV